MIHAVQKLHWGLNRQWFFFFFFYHLISLDINLLLTNILRGFILRTGKGYRRHQAASYRWL